MTKINSIRKNLKIAVVGLGYVGLPLAIELGKKFLTIGYDINKIRVNELKNGIDINQEIKKKDISSLKNLNFSNDVEKIKQCNCYIITVPTPIFSNKKPNLKYIFEATEVVGKILKLGDLVIYESTVYPGLTEEECVPILEKYSNLQFNKDFFCGYSPERINPGDKSKNIRTIKKITSGSTPKAALLVDSIYSSIIEAGTYRVSSIKIAEAAKVIENTQRDLNIALMNELSILFNKLNLNTEDVLKAAGSKWNFLPFRPGLVGGHCIGVDPYYLTYKAEEVGYKPKIILAGRKLNDDMGNIVVKQLTSLMRKKRIKIKNSKILIMGLVFKENCTDLRNSGIYNVIKILKKFKCKIDLYDPWADSAEVKSLYNISPKQNLIQIVMMEL